MPKPGYKRTKEHQQKLADSLRGRRIPNEVRRKISRARKGKVMPKEIRMKISESNRIAYKSGKRKPYWLGKKFSVEHRAKIGIKSKGHKYLLGKKRSPESIKKQADSIRGKNHWRWKGGYENHLWHARRRRVLKLQNGGHHTLEEWLTLKEKCRYTCQVCKEVEPKIKLTVDHIIPLTMGGTDDIENVQPLCAKCNSKKGNKIMKGVIIRREKI